MSITNKTSMKPTVGWDEIDKFRFFFIGTGMYSGLTILLHPITVIKVRQQVLDDATNEKNKLLKHLQNKHHYQPPKLRTIIHETIDPKNTNGNIHKWKGFYRGLPTILSIAVPSRALYITVLEESRTKTSNILTYYCTDTQKSLFTLSGIQTLSGGIAGGLAAMVAQLCVVPMDVISQKQMISNDPIPAISIIQDILSKEGYRGLYKGFGISLFNSLPTGIVWWATYGGMQQYLFQSFNSNKTKNFVKQRDWIKTGLIQLGSGISAAIVASVLTQPLDVIKTRLQVMEPTLTFTSSKKNSSSIHAIIKELNRSEGIRGFFRGTGPRILHMGLWGTVLSSAFEYLKNISQKQ